MAMGKTYDKERALRRQKFGLRTRGGPLWCKTKACPYAWSCDDLKESRAVYGERCAWLTRAEEVWLTLAQVELGVRLDVLAEKDQRVVKTFVRAITRRLLTQRAVAETGLFVKKSIQLPTGLHKETVRSPALYHDRRASSLYINAYHRFEQLRRKVWAEYGVPKRTTGDVLEEAGVDLEAGQLWM
jgi:hypothetical protein